jgi:hypothetical protein
MNVHGRSVHVIPDGLGRSGIGEESGVFVAHDPGSSLREAGMTRIAV